MIDVGSQVCCRMTMDTGLSHYCDDRSSAIIGCARVSGLGEGPFGLQAEPVPERNMMANYSRWEDIKSRRPTPSAETRAGVHQDLALGQLIYDLRTHAGLSQRTLAERMATTQSVISRLEEGGGANNRLDTLARVAAALGRHLVITFPEQVPTDIVDGVLVA